MIDIEPFGDRPAVSRSNVLDSSANALPIEFAAHHIDSDVLSALARWRDVDQFSLHDLAPTLWTKNGEFVGDSAGYLHALHGFVAEKLVHSDLAGQHDVMWPDRTNVPAYDMIVDGAPVQIKEGTSAYQAVNHALERYPNVTSFVTDSSTAADLRQHGIDALGVDRLDPDLIARITNESVEGLSALEQVGQLHVPIITTVVSLCKYWERYDAEQIEALTAVKFAAVDISAQSIGAAVGMKAAATYVVATGGFGLAALPLTLGAIVGAMGLRHIVNQRRARALRECLREFENSRNASEMAAEIITAHSRSFVLETFETVEVAIRRENSDRAAQWAVIRDTTLLRVCSTGSDACRSLVSSIQQDAPETISFIRQLSDAFAETEVAHRYLSIDSCLRRILSSPLEIPISARFIAVKWFDDAREEVEVLNHHRSRLEAKAASALSALERKARLDLLSEYALLLGRLSKVTKPTIDAISRVKAESEKIGGKA